jgi:aspartyl-tRNA(Asn)/glutamyl-tRNA(Gln) amidotransferase subunit A
MESKIFTYINTSPLPGGDGPMAGTCVAVESTISVADWPTDAQSIALENYVALEDATLIQQLRQAGATLKGRTAMGELGMGLDRDTCGEAINNGLSDLVLKTDTAGEARMAAAAVGCFGFKPSYGLISRSGVIGLVPSMETCGILSRSLETISTTARTMAGLDAHDPSMDKAGIDQALSGFDHPETFQDSPLTLGVIREWNTDRHGKDVLEQAIATLGNTGVQIQEVSIQDISLARTVHNVIGSVEASSSAGRFDSVRYGHRTGALVKNWNDMYIKSRGESFGPLVKAYLFQGGYFQYRNYTAFVDACRIRARLVQSVEKAFEAVDLIVLPVLGNPGATWEKPATVSAFYDMFSFTVLANLTGNPSITIPAYITGNKTGPALQLMGNRFDDARLIALAARVSDIYTGGIKNEI